MQKQEFEDQLAHFTGTTAYHSLKPLSDLKMTDGALWLHEKSSVLQDIAIRASHDPELAKEEFLSAKVTVKDDGVSTYTIDDGNENMLYKSGACNYDLPPVEFTIFVQNNVIFLSTEY